MSRLRPTSTADRVPGRLRPHGDQGTTLAELLVSLVVFTVLAMTVATTVLGLTRMVRVSAERETTAQRASTVVQQISKDLRTATRVGPAGSEVAFVAASPSEVVFYSGVEPQIVKERLHVSGGVLLRTTTLPDATSRYPNLTFTGTGGTTTRQIGRSDLGTAGLFTYVLKGTTTKLTTVSGTALRDVAAVGVTVAVDPDGAAGPQRAVVLETTVRPYNL